MARDQTKRAATPTTALIKPKPITVTKGRNQVPLFQAAGLSIPIAFQDSGEPLSPKLQQIIPADLQLIYGHLDSFEILTFSPRSFSIGGRNIAASKRIQLVGEGRYRPEAHRNQFGWIVQVDGVEHLVIPKELIEAYRQVDNLRDSQKSADRKLDEFAAMLESSDPQRFAGMGPQDLIWSAELEGKGPEMWQHVFREFQKQSFQRPSFLEFVVVDKEREPNRWKGFPDGVIVASAMALNERGIPTGYWPLVYLRGKWHFAILHEP